MRDIRSITAVIIDDDPFASSHLKTLLRNKTTEVGVLAVANSAEQGLELITKLSPDVVFLDIEMPGMNGFELLRRLPTVNFDVIFTTSHEHYAVKAIRYSAVDYLIKPIDASELQEAVAKVIVKLEKQKKT